MCARISTRHRKQHAAGVSSVISVVRRKDELGGDDLLHAPRIPLLPQPARPGWGFGDLPKSLSHRRAHICSDILLPCFSSLQMPPLSVGTFWTFQERKWLDAFWAYRWLFIYCRSGVRDNLLPHRRPTPWAELRIPGLTQLLAVNSRANVCFHEVTPFSCRIALRRNIRAPQTEGK